MFKMMSVLRKAQSLTNQFDKVLQEPEVAEVVMKKRQKKEESKEVK
jgi:hypothetical protein